MTNAVNQLLNKYVNRGKKKSHNEKDYEMTNRYETYLINLAREPGKRSEFMKRNHETGLDFNIFPAIDGNEFVLNEFIQNGLLNANSVGYTNGQLGCGASHFVLWKNAESSQKNFLIFEDDAYCRRDITHHIQKLLATLKDWDIILLGYNTDAILDFKISDHFDFGGFFSNPRPSHEQLQEFTKTTDSISTVRLNNAFGTCSYLISPQGARKMISLFPMDNRQVVIPGNNVKYGTDTFYCITIDMIMNTLYRHINAYATIPPLVIPLNNPTTSTTREHLTR